MNEQQQTISWSRVMGLAALQGTISVTWLVYNAYLPHLLAQFGFSIALAQIILIIENLLAAVVEPAAGAASDRAAHRLYGRFSIISKGVIAAAAIFVIIPLIAIVWTPTGMLRWLLPIILIIWALAMATFRSPALSLLKRTASNNNLPQAAAVLTILTGLFAAVRPFVANFILNLGPLAAFAIGSAGLLIGLLILRLVFPTNTSENDEEISEVPDESDTLQPHLLKLALVFAIGLSGAWSFRYGAAAVSTLLTAQFPARDTAVLMAIFFFSLACIALPLGRLATKLSNTLTIFAGTATAAAALLITAGLASNALWLITALCVAIGISTLTTGAVPFALTLLPPRWSGLAVGAQFAGFTLATSAFHTARTLSIPPTTNLLLAAGAFTLATICAIIGRRFTPKDPT